MQLFDTHCHIHDDKYNYDVPEIRNRAKKSGVVGMVCVGTSALDSKKAVEFE